MKGKDLIEIIQKNKLEDFDIRFQFNDWTNDKMSGFTMRGFDINSLDDVGYSDKVVLLGGKEKED